MLTGLGFIAPIVTLIIQVICVLLSIKAAIEIWHMNFSQEKRLSVIVILLVTNWVGVCVYYFYARKKLEEWLK